MRRRGKKRKRFAAARKLKRGTLNCRKVVIKSREEAETALETFGKARGSIRYYRCYRHGDEEVWHLTSKKWNPSDEYR